MLCEECLANRRSKAAQPIRTYLRFRFLTEGREILVAGIGWFTRISTNPALHLPEQMREIAAHGQRSGARFASQGRPEGCVAGIRRGRRVWSALLPGFGPDAIKRYLAAGTDGDAVSTLPLGAHARSTQGVRRGHNGWCNGWYFGRRRARGRPV